MNNPQPRIDESGVPFCSSFCPNFEGKTCLGMCALTESQVTCDMDVEACLPAVRQMAARIRELEERLRPKTVEELLDECRKWQLTDEELEQLNK